MQLHQLPSTTIHKKKRRGQGYGSGKGGHTSGRGQKGQRTRGTIAIWFEGGQLPQIRRFPFVRGKGRFQTIKPKTVVLNLTALNRLPKNSLVNPKTLLAAKLVKERALSTHTIKILGRGEITIPLTVEVLTSQKAAAKIVAAGGKVNRVESH